MAPLSSESLLIGRVPSGEIGEALRLVLAELPDEQTEQYVRTLAAEIGSAADAGEGLLEARRGLDRVGAAWFQVLAGRSALVWPPRVVAGEPAATAGQLMAAGCELLARRDVRVANAILSTVAPEDDAVLRAADFAPLASLVYMACEESAFPQAQPAGRLEFEPWGPAKEDRLARLVEATYEGTLDCPAMNGLRRTEDVLAGYRAAGTFSAERWLFARHEGRDVGCLLLGDYPAAGNVELVYMGLSPACRGKGLGKEICRHAQWLARQLGRLRLVAAVDAANVPAIGMYASVGLSVWDRRVVYLRSFRPP
jgi:ribosomal protein S18 acetylase RimI-like enzyme